MTDPRINKDTRIQQASIQQTSQNSKVSVGKSDRKVSAAGERPLVEVQKKSISDRMTVDRATTTKIYEELGELVRGDVENQGEMTDAHTKKAFDLMDGLVFEGQEPEHLEFVRDSVGDAIVSEKLSAERKEQGFNILSKLVNTL